MNNITHDPDDSRFIISVDGTEAGACHYVQKDGVRNFNHTVVYEEFQGQGLSKPLIKQSLDHTRDEGLKIIAQCPAVARFIQKNPEYADLLK